MFLVFLKTSQIVSYAAELLYLRCMIILTRNLTGQKGSFVYMQWIWVTIAPLFWFTSFSVDVYFFWRYYVFLSWCRSHHFSKLKHLSFETVLYNYGTTFYLMFIIPISGDRRRWLNWVLWFFIFLLCYPSLHIFVNTLSFGTGIGYSFHIN